MKVYGIMIAITISMSLLDIITGYLGAVIKKEVSSSAMRNGLVKKAVLVVVQAVAALLQFGQQWIDLGIDIPILTITCTIIIWLEVTSILENANKIMNGRLTDLINKIIPSKRKGDENEEDND